MCRKVWYKVYEKSKKSGKPEYFEYGRFPINDISPVSNSTDKSWPFGRMSGRVEGNLLAIGENEYSIDGVAIMQDDYYDWNQDGDDMVHNYGISVMAGNWNGPNSNDLVNGTILSNTPGTFEGFTWNSSMNLSSNPELVKWDQVSPSYGTDNGVPIRYERDYYFRIKGKIDD